MTHDELLAKVDKRQYHPITGEVLTGTIYYRYLEALRAVVELHSIEEWGPMEEWGKKEPFSIYICSKCKVPYPCPTIQVIEKELQ